MTKKTSDSTPKTTKQPDPAIKKATPKVKKSTTKAEKDNAKKSKVAAKVAEKSETSAGKKLDLCLLLDCTASMRPWIQRSKDTLKTIIDSVKAGHPGLEVRVSFVGYRDIDIRVPFEILDFDSDLDKVKQFISKVEASSELAPGAKVGLDTSEDV